MVVTFNLIYHRNLKYSVTSKMKSKSLVHTTLTQQDLIVYIYRLFIHIYFDLTKEYCMYQ
jgi:hypothetical protein